MRCRLRGAIYVVQPVWCNVRGAIYVVQSTWCNLCGAFYAVPSMWAHVLSSLRVPSSPSHLISLFPAHPPV
eukprot:5831373-Pyramimonas_sp.AAC.1